MRWAPGVSEEVHEEVGTDHGDHQHSTLICLHGTGVQYFTVKSVPYLTVLLTLYRPCTLAAILARRAPRSNALDHTQRTHTATGTGLCTVLSTAKGYLGFI